MTPSDAQKTSFAVRVHPQFLNLYFILLVVAALRGDGIAELWRLTVGFSLTAAALLLHELGHAWVARRAGIVVDSVVVHPLGGMARLLWGAEDPRLEARVAAAGPATNLLLAAASFAGGRAFADDAGAAPWAADLFLRINLVVGLGNLLPAFPADGGRIVRALLARRHGRAEATRRAVRLGRATALALVASAFVLAATTDLPRLVLLALPLTAGALVVLGEIERLKETARAATRDFEARVRGAPRGRGPEDGVIEATGASRVLDDPPR